MSRIQLVPGAPSGLPGWLIKQGIAKDAQGAERILLGIAIVAVGVAIAVPAVLLHKSGHNPTPTELNRYIQQMSLRAKSIPPAR